MLLRKKILIKKNQKLPSSCTNPKWFIINCSNTLLHDLYVNLKSSYWALVTGWSYKQLSIPGIGLDNDHPCLTGTSLGNAAVEQGAGTVLAAKPPVVGTTKELVINSQSHRTAQLLPGTNQNTQENERTNCGENDHTAQNKELHEPETEKKKVASFRQKADAELQFQ